LNADACQIFSPMWMAFLPRSENCERRGKTR
jgi:hypothetical protein